MPETPAPQAPAPQPQASPPTTNQGRWEIPELPRDWKSHAAKLGQSTHGSAVVGVLKPLLDRDQGGVCWQAIKEAWTGYAAGSGMPPLGQWPLHLQAIIGSTISAWAKDYRAWEAGLAIKPDKDPSKDWRVQVAQHALTPEAFTERPEVPRFLVPLTVIPEWIEGQTRLVLLPAPGMLPPWLPAVVHFQPEDSPFQEHTLHQNGMMLEVEGLRDLAFTPPAKGSGRLWLLRLAHLQGAAWSTAPRSSEGNGQET